MVYMGLCVCVRVDMCLTHGLLFVQALGMKMLRTIDRPEQKVQSIMVVVFD